MTIWKARRAKRGGPPVRILCGFMVEGRHCCVEQLAQAALWSADETTFPTRDEIWLPVGLTDDGSPREYRWSKYAADRIKRHESPSIGRGGGETRSIRIDHPIVVPCRQGHRNRIDGEVLSA